MTTRPAVRLQRQQTAEEIVAENKAGLPDVTKDGWTILDGPAELCADLHDSKFVVGDIHYRGNKSGRSK